VSRFSNIVTNIRCRLADVRNRSFMPDHELARLLGAEGVLYTLMITLAHNNNNLYASRLGAGASDLGLIASLPPVVGMLSLIPFAIIADRLHNKKPMVMLSALALGLMYILVGMAAFLDSSRVPVLILLLVLANIPMSLYNSSWQAFFSDAVKPCDRNLVYSHRTRMNTAVGIAVPLLAGAILTAASGSGKILVHQIYYWLAFPLAVGQVILLHRASGGSSAETNHIRLSDVKESARLLFHSRKFLGFLAVAFIAYCGWELDWSLYFLAQFRYLHMNETQMSLISVFSAAAQFVTIGLWSRLVQKKGVRFVFIIGVAGFAFCCISLVLSLFLAPPFQLPFYYLFQSIGGSAYSAFLISLFQCLLEAIPHKNRALSIAIYNTIILFSNIVMPYLGVYMYNSMGESLKAMIYSMAIIAAVRIFAVLAAGLRWFRLRKVEEEFV